MNHLPKLNRYIPLWQRNIPRYPLYIKGNPQLRVHLPLFWVKLIKWDKALPSDTQAFLVHHQMTEYDVKNYLEKIYKLKVLTVKTILKRGVERTNPSYGFPINPGPDRRYAFVQMEGIEDFEFPNIFKGKKSVQEELGGNTPSPPAPNPLSATLPSWIR